MLSKCANPTCRAKLLYLGDGKIFRVEHAATTRGAEAPRKPADAGHFEVVVGGEAGKAEYFWLCGGCANEMTLALNEKQLVILPKGKKTMAQAAAS